MNIDINAVLDEVATWLATQTQDSRSKWLVENYKNLDLAMALIPHSEGKTADAAVQEVEAWAERIRPKLHLIESVKVTRNKYLVVTLVLKKGESKKDPKGNVWERLPELYKELNGNVRAISNAIGRSEPRVRQKLKEMKTKRGVL